jgi:antitoxin component YwqK of YwqJK toxin-antitoxin module
MNETEVVEYVTLFEKGKKVYFEKRKNNKIVKKYFLANEQIVGYAFYYDEYTGEINIILNYENGKIKDGIYNYYHQGQLLRKEEFKDGVLVKKYWNDEFKDFEIYEQELLKQP